MAYTFSVTITPKLFSHITHLLISLLPVIQAMTPLGFGSNHCGTCLHQVPDLFQDLGLHIAFIG